MATNNSLNKRTPDWTINNYIMPLADGQVGQTIETDGLGNLSFAGGTDITAALSVAAATTLVLPGTPTYNNGVAGVGATLTRVGNGALTAQDGVVLINADRLLVKNQATTLQNGVYEVTDIGSAGTPYILTRTTDSDEDTEFDNQIVVPTSGTTQQNQIFGQTTQSPVIGTNPIVYVTLTNTYVTQSVTGTQTNLNIPNWTANARQLTRGDIGLQIPGTTFATGQLRLGQTNQAANLLMRSGTNVSNVTIGYQAAGSASAFLFANIAAGGEMRHSIAGTTSTETFFSNAGKRLEMGNSYLSFSPHAVGAGSTMEARFLELAASGTNYVGFKGPDAITANIMWVLPNADSTGTQALTSNGSGTLGWSTFGTGNVTASGTAPRIPFFASATALSDSANWRYLAAQGLHIENNTTDHSLYIGGLTGNATSTGDQNTALGYGSGVALTTGGFNTLVGAGTGNVLADGINNVIVGNAAGLATTSGDSNVFVGFSAGLTNITGDNNVYIGEAADGATTSTTGAIALGFGASAATNQFALANNITHWKFQGDSYTLPTAFPSANDQALASSTAGVLTWGSVVTSGFYTPTLTNVSNLAASTVYDATYMRVGNVVTVAGRVEIDPTNPATLTELGISLPIASNIAGLEGVCGTAAASNVAGQVAAIVGDAANNRAQLQYISSDITNQSMYYTYQYFII